MEIHISNFLGIVDVVVPLDDAPVAVMGPNASGKSSLATAIGAILARNSNPLALGAKARPYVHDAAETGSVVLRQDGVEFRRWLLADKGIRVFPDGPGDQLKHVLGLVNFIALPPKARADAWEACFLPEPQELVRMVGKELEEQLATTAAVDEVTAMLRIKKWNECASIFGYKATEAKREWEKTTGEHYGVRKADRWNPSGWRSDLDTMTPVEAKSILEQKRESLRLVSIQQAVSEGQSEAARQAALEIPGLQNEVLRLADKHDVAKAQHDAIARESTALRERGIAARDTLSLHDRRQPIRENSVPCPSCGDHLVIGPDNSLTRAKDEESFNAQLQAWQTGRARLEDVLVNLRAEAIDLKDKRLAPVRKAAEKAHGELAEVRSRLQMARAQAEKDGATVITSEAERAALEAEQAVDDAKSAVDLVNRKVAAQNAHMTATNYARVAYALGPKGIRSRSMETSMQALDGALQDMEEITTWPHVEVEAATYAVAIGGRGGPVCAQSEQWRATFLLQCAIAVVLGENWIIADGADILDDTCRGQFIALVDWLAERDVYTIACATGSLGTLPPTWKTVEIVNGRRG